jgi:hypothetical protein
MRRERGRFSEFSGKPYHLVQGESKTVILVDGRHETTESQIGHMTKTGKPMQWGFLCIYPEFIQFPGACAFSPFRICHASSGINPELVQNPF